MTNQEYVCYCDPYVTQGTDDVLINSLGIRDADELRKKVIDTRSQKWRQSVYNFSISIDGLRDCHKHLLGDIYPWAGFFIYENIQLSKGKNIGPLNVTLHKEGVVKARKQADDLSFVFEPEFCKIMNECRKIRKRDRKGFIRMARAIIIQLMKDHPFRDGNMMTTQLFIREFGRILDIEYEPGYGCSSQERDKLIQNWNRCVKYFIDYERYEYIEEIIERCVPQISHNLVSLKSVKSSIKRRKIFPSIGTWFRICRVGVFRRICG